VIELHPHSISRLPQLLKRLKLLVKKRSLRFLSPLLYLEKLKDLKEKNFLKRKKRKLVSIKLLSKSI